MQCFFAEVAVAGGTESMTMIPMGGNKVSANPWLVSNYPDVYLSMGLTAERLAKRFNITREEADQFSLRSHQKATAAIQAGRFDDEVVPVPVSFTTPNGSKPKRVDIVFKTDEGPRAETTLEAMLCGIAQVRPGATLGDIGHAIQKHAEAQGFSIVREYCGHGIGQIYHEDPQVLHYGQPGAGLRLQKGMTFTIEPMVNAGKAHTRLLPDGWTVVTKDHSLSAQWEHTIAVTDDGHEILTPWPSAA